MKGRLMMGRLGMGRCGTPPPLPCINNHPRAGKQADPHRRIWALKYVGHDGAIDDGAIDDGAIGDGAIDMTTSSLLP